MCPHRLALWAQGIRPHLASAQQLQISGLPFLAFDLRQAQAARSLGLVVLGS